MTPWEAFYELHCSHCLRDALARSGFKDKGCPLIRRHLAGEEITEWTSQEPSEDDVCSKLLAYGSNRTKKAKRHHHAEVDPNQMVMFDEIGAILVDYGDLPTIETAACLV